MHSTLPDPVLALSLANVQKLNNIDVDQLANLWNVFSKCKESLESGRRLENLSWRLWFREAHLLPPETSLSDLTDYTPLDTPLMSRRGSVAGSAPSSRAMPAPIGQTALPGLPSVQLQQYPSPCSQPLSDPEDGADWSDDEGEDEEEEVVEASVSNANRGRKVARSDSGTAVGAGMAKESPTKGATSATAAALSPQRASGAAIASQALRSAGLAVGEGVAASQAGSLQPIGPGPGDRKRAVSSSSAFGSRARVKQHNAIRRRRPLSFQQAIESLLLDRSKDFCQDERDVAPPSQPPQSSSFQEGKANVGVNTNGNHWRADDHLTETAMQQSSAPAEFSQPNTPSMYSTATFSAVDKAEGDAERKRMPPPSSVPSRSKRESGENEDGRQLLEGTGKRDAKFFVAGQSVESSSSVNGSLAPIHQSSRAVYLSPNHSPEYVAPRRSPSEAASDHSHHRQGHPRSHHGHGQQHQHTVHPTGKSQHALHAASKNRSAVGLNRAGGGGAMGRGRGHGRVTSGGRGAHGVSGMHGKAPSLQQHQQHQQQHDVSRSGAVEKEKDGREEEQVTSKARPPVKFTMGVEDDEDEFTDESSEEEGQRSQAAPKSKAVVGRGQESDEWSSASSTDSEEVRKRTVAQKRREEEARQQAMFKKVPIKSASTVDVRNLGRRLSSPSESQVDEEAQQSNMAVQPVRGLLSSLFHPEEGPHPPPGQLAGRPHASAADLRSRPKRLSDSRSDGKMDGKRESEETPRTTASSSSQLPSMGSLKLSKSAVALPVLSTTGSRSEAKKGDVHGSRQSAVFDEDEYSEASEAEGGGPTSEALARLNELASKRKRIQRESKKRTSNSSLNVEVAPEIGEEEMRAESRQRESAKTAIATPSLSSHRKSTSMINVPEVSMPQTPRTTRRNMLRDELSESLRQNLLWERQSRNRMLGIGALPQAPPRNTAINDARSRSQVAPQSRNHSVLAGGALRPLTSSNSTTNVSDRRTPTNQTNNNNAHHHYTGDFHHAGW